LRSSQALLDRVHGFIVFKSDARVSKVNPELRKADLSVLVESMLIPLIKAGSSDLFEIILAKHTKVYDFFLLATPTGLLAKKQGESITGAIPDRILHDFNPIEINEGSRDDHSMREINRNNASKYCDIYLCETTGSRHRSHGSHSSDWWLSPNGPVALLNRYIQKSFRGNQT
jgi:hypothetical protein